MPVSAKKPARLCACKLPKLPLLPEKRQSRANLPTANEMRIRHSSQRRPQHKMRSLSFKNRHSRLDISGLHQCCLILDNIHLQRYPQCNR